MGKDKYCYKKGSEAKILFYMIYPPTNQCLYMNFVDCIPKIL